MSATGEPHKDQSGSGQYQGSEAFANVILAQNESVNPSTGTLNFYKSVVKLRGKRDSINVVLNVTYTPGSLGTFGLPDGWGLKLPHVIPGASVTVGGRTYAIDFGWTDAKNHKSGLRYLNDHGVQFELKNPALPLPSGNRGEYTYRLLQGDGSVDYFDATGKPIEHEDLFGNNIHYTYASGGGGPRNFLLDYIEDSWGQRVQFKYQPGSQMIIIAPDQGKTIFNLSNQGVQTIEDPVGLTTRFQYGPSTANDKNILTQITYPTGLISRFSYGRIEYLDRSGTSGYISAVQSHRHLDESGTILARTDYLYGSLSSGSTFTGFKVGCKMGGLRDDLMDGSARYSGYTYDVMKIRLDEAGKKLAATTCWFNHMHLPVYQIDHTVGKTGSLVDTFRVDFKYDISSDEHGHSPSYSKPSVTTHSRLTGSGSRQSYQPMNRVLASYNEFGNVLTTQQDMWVPGLGYVKQQTSSFQYILTKWNGHDSQMALAESNKDEVSGFERHTQHTLSDDQKTIQKTIISFITGSDSGEEPQPWKEQLHKYDKYGRMTASTIGWSVNPGSFAAESPSSATTTSGYDFKGGILVETTTDPLGNAAVASYDMRVASGPVACRVKSMGQAETFEYDLLGRVVKHNDYLGQQTRTVNPNVSSPNTMKVTDSLGYTVLTTFDAMGRTIMIADNGDPTITSLDPVRTLSQTKFDCLSQPKEKSDISSLRTTYTVDALSRPLVTKAPDGNVTSYEYDDATGKATEKINGDIRIVSYFDGQSRITRRVQYPDSSDTLENYLEMATTYDGNNRKTSEVASQIPRTGSSPVIPLKEVLFEYDAGSSIISKTEIGTVQNRQDIVLRKYTLDLFCNRYKYSKQTTYSDGTVFTHQGPISLYDQANRFVALTNQLGQRERREYNANGWVTKTVRFDGTEIAYEYDAAGQAIKITSPTQVSQIDYICVDRKARVTQDGQSMDYEYSRDGTLKSVTYEDGGKQIYDLDRMSRVVGDTDVFGAARQVTFDEKGRVLSRSCQGDTYRFTYGFINHTESQVVSVDLDGEKKYNRSFLYDGFGRVKRETVSAPDSTILLDTTYAFDAKQQLQDMQSKSKISPDLNVNRQYVYDGIGQLVQDSTQHSMVKYAYDGNSNIISVDTDGQIKRMTYNAIDQRADPEFEYDTNGRMLRDDVGLQYVFDEQDRLLSVQTSTMVSSVFSYHADDLLAKHETVEKTSSLYYNSQQDINAMQVTDPQGDGKTSMFSNGDSLAAAYSNSSPPTYLLDQRGSTAVILESEKSSGLTYQAYGSPNVSISPTTATGHCSSSFQFQQEYHDSTTGLVYLRSRFYDPDQMAFVSMDSSLKENRYAYCSGDPINLVDPSGHSWTAYVLGAALGIFTGLVAGALATPVVGAMLGETTAAVLITAMIGGVVGNVTAGGVAADVDGLGYRLGDFGRDVAVGAIGALAATGAGIMAAALAGVFGVVGAGAAATVMVAMFGTAVGAAAGTVFEDIYMGREIDWRNAAVNAGAGLFFGFLMGATAARAPRGRWFQRLVPRAGELRLNLANAGSSSARRSGPSWAVILSVMTSFCKPNVNGYRHFRDDDDDEPGGRDIPMRRYG